MRFDYKRPRPVNKIIFSTPQPWARLPFALAAIRERDPGVTSSRLLLRPQPPNERPFPLFDPISRYRERMGGSRSGLLCITSVAFRSDVLHPKVKAVSFICILDKEVLKSVLPVCRGERLFTDSAMEQATWKSRLRTHANEFVS